MHGKVWNGLLGGLGSTLQGCKVSIYYHLHKLYCPDQVHNSHLIFLWVFNLILYIVSCQGENKNKNTNT